MHVADLDLGILGANGVVGGGVPIAAGAALGARMQGYDRVAVSFVGDGGTDIGPFHETLNLAALWEVPVVFVVENNGYADFIAQNAHQKIERISDRADGYGMPGATVDGNDVEAVHDSAAEAVERARSGRGPTLLECVTYRWRGHFEGDPQPYRTDDEVAEWKKKDPLLLTEARLRDRDGIDDMTIDDLRDEARRRIDAAVEFAEREPMPDGEAALTDVYTDLTVGGW